MERANGESRSRPIERSKAGTRTRHPLILVRLGGPFSEDQDFHREKITRLIQPLPCPLKILVGYQMSRILTARNTQLMRRLIASQD